MDVEHLNTTYTKNRCVKSLLRYMQLIVCCCRVYVTGIAINASMATPIHQAVVSCTAPSIRKEGTKERPHNTPSVCVCVCVAPIGPVALLWGACADEPQR